MAVEVVGVDGVEETEEVGVSVVIEEEGASVEVIEVDSAVAVVEVEEDVEVDPNQSRSSSKCSIRLYAHSFSVSTSGIPTHHSRALIAL